MSTWCRHVHVRPHCLILTEACSCRLKLAYFAGKISKNRLVCKNAVTLAYYGSCRLLVMGSWKNHAIRLIFFARTLGKSTESALPLLNLLDVLTVNNIYRLHILKFTHLWHKGLLPVLFQSYFQYASSIHGYNTRYASKQNLYKPKERTNSGKQTVAFAASVLWDSIPVDLKSLNVFNFSKKLKHYLLSEQHSETLS